MAEDPSRRPEEGKEPRSLITLVDDHQCFLDDGSRVSHAKNFKGEVKAKIKISPVVVFRVLSRMVLVRES